MDRMGVSPVRNAMNPYGVSSVAPFRAPVDPGPTWLAILHAKAPRHGLDE